MNRKDAFISRLIALTLSVLMIFGMLPLEALAVGNESVYGSVQSSTEGITLTGTGPQISAVYAAGSLTWANAEPSTGRGEGWGIDLTVTAPAQANLEQANYTYDGIVKKIRGDQGFSEDSSEQYLRLWAMLTPELLRDANLANGVIEHQWTFDWDGDGNFEQSLNLRVDAAQVRLMKDTVMEYPKTELGFGTVRLEGSAISGNQTADVQASYTQPVTVAWQEAETATGRPQGWYAKLEIAAPDTLSEELLKTVRYRRNQEQKSWAEPEAPLRRSLTEWVPLHGLLSGTMDSVLYTFDWNNDGLFEQKICLTVDPAMVVLTKNGTQVYPVLGQVNSYQGAEVTGSGTGSVEVTLRNAALDWSEGDSAQGQTRSWRAGIKVEAPADLAPTALRNAVFQSKNAEQSWEMAAEAGSFWEQKNSQDGEASQYISLWLCVSPNALAEAKAAGKMLEKDYRFDWDGNGSYDQEIAFRIDPNSQIVLNQKDQTDFKFAVETPQDIWIGNGSFQNQASGGQGDGAVTYQLIKGDAAVVAPDTGIVTFSHAGTVTVQATKAGDRQGFYREAKTEYIITAFKKDQQLRFQVTEPSPLTYQPGLTFENPVQGAQGGQVTYQIVGEDQNGYGVAEIDPMTGRLTIQKAGRVTVQAVAEGNEHYNSQAVTYTVEIRKAPQPDFAMVDAPTELTWQETAQDAIPLAHGKGDGKILWTITQGQDVAQVDDNGRITLKKAGSFTIQAQKDGDERYLPSAPVCTSILVVRAAQTGLSFAKAEDSMTYHDNGNRYVQTASGGQGSGAISYTVISGSAAEVQEQTGVVTILTAGDVTIKATKAADDRYGEASAVYTLHIGKAAQSYRLSQAGVAALTYGTRSYTNALVSDDQKVSRQNQPVYTITENTIGAAIRPETGEVTFGDSRDQTGTARVTASVAGDACYLPFTASYDLEVSYLPLPEGIRPQITGTTRNDSGWYVDQVSIHAPQGYQIAYENALTTKWSDAIPYAAEGIGDAVVYLRDAHGWITDRLTVAEIRLDTQAPAQDKLRIQYDTPTWEKILEMLSFGIYRSDSLAVRFEAEDDGSGIASLTYRVGGVDTVIPFSGEKTVSHSIVVQAQYRNQITLTAEDVSGRQTQIHSDHVLVLDTKHPMLQAAYEFASGQSKETGGTLYSSDDVTIRFTMEETNFDLSDAPEVLVNEQAQTVSWTRLDDTDQWQAVLTLSGNADYLVKVSFADAAANEMEPFEQKIHIDQLPPAVEVEFDNLDAQNGSYYQADRKAVVTVTEHNFSAEDIQVYVSARNILNQDVSVMDYAAYAKNPENWMHEGDVHRLELPFTVDAAYHMEVVGSDHAQNVSNRFETDFTVDHNAADRIRIEYSEPISEKLLSLLTFGIYQAKAVVTVSAEDLTSGVDHFLLTYTRAADASPSNQADFTTERLPAQQDQGKASGFTASYELMPQADGCFRVEVVDRAGNRSEKSDSRRIVVDHKIPTVDVQYTYASGAHHAEQDMFYTQDAVTVSFFVNEANFPLAEAPVATVNGYAQEVIWEAAGEDRWLGQMRLSGDGDYQIGLTFTDASTNEMTAYQQQIRIDSQAPLIDVSYDNDTCLNGSCYGAERNAVITITEHNFKAQNVDVQVKAQNILQQTVEVMDYTAYAKDSTHWDSEGDVHRLHLPFTTDAIYTVRVECQDLAGNAGENLQPAFSVDKVGPEQIRLTYSKPVIRKILEALSFGFYQSDVTVTVTAEDQTTGVDYFELFYTRDGQATTAHQADFMQRLEAKPGTDAGSFTASYTMPAQARGSFAVKAYDRAGNASEAEDPDAMIVTDTVGGKIEIAYSRQGADYRDAEQNPVDTFAQAEHAYYQTDASVSIAIREANFFEGRTMGPNQDQTVHEVLLKVTKTDNAGAVTVTEYLCDGAEQLVPGAAVKPIEWITDGDLHTTELTFTEDGDYVLELSYKDFSENDAAITGSDGNSARAAYVSKVITVDQTAPVIEVEYDNHSARNENCYQSDRTATITVTEHNFKAEEFVAAVTGRDIFGQETALMDYEAYARTPENWTHNGDVHTLRLPFEADAEYQFSGSYTDLAGNAASFEEPSFLIDHLGAEHIRIDYSVPVLQKMIKALSFGFYQTDMVVTVTAEDRTSGVEYFDLIYTRDGAATEAHTADFTERLAAKPGTDAKTFTASYTLSAQARGSFGVRVADRAGNISEAQDHTGVVVTDTVSPEIHIDYAPQSPDTKVRFVDNRVQDVQSAAEAANVFYNGAVCADITVQEANFFEGQRIGADSEETVHALTIRATRTDDHGQVSVTEYLCEGAEQHIPGAEPKLIQWKTVGDTHTAQLIFAEDGDYVLELSYSDFSQNPAHLHGSDGIQTEKHYVSKILTVDRTAPVIAVSYGTPEIVHTIGSRAYYNQKQSAVITVTEHNFRPAEIAAEITAKDVVGHPIAVADFSAMLSDGENWSHDGNVHTAQIFFTEDANYTFDVDYTDLAGNSSADYPQDLFTVDTTPPRNLEVRYSTSILEQIKQSVTFGYYNAKMTVTICAEDDISGIYHFAYSYIKEPNVSDVNVELLNQAVEEAEITYDGKRAEAKFTIPKLVLGSDNQFHGVVSFTAFDRCEHRTEQRDSRVVIVDNIAPTARITYNAPTQTANDISYYDGAIHANLVIQEANFDAADVVVSVTKNGAAYPVYTAWRSASVDTHTGSFALTEDGDYVVSVQYRDKSGNRMQPYTSNQLTLDQTKPVIEVSDIRANSANKRAAYGFTLTVRDTNLDLSAVKPVLKAVKQNGTGAYEVAQIRLGQGRIEQNGQVCRYTIDDLPEDGLYTLSCEAQDLAGNSMAQLVLEDGTAYDQVPFSINRSGSAFGYGNDFTEKLAEQYYVYQVDEDVVLVEVNVDPIDRYAVSLNGEKLEEGTDYTTTQTSRDGEWSKRSYTIRKELFQPEGEYSVIVSSVDKTDTTAYSDVKNLTMSFVVDRTKPAMTITGLEAGGRYQTHEQTVTLIPTDEGGRLNSLCVVVLDSNGKPIADENGTDLSVRFEKTGEELLQYLEEHDGKVIFTIPEGLNNQVQIRCSDCALHADQTTNLYDELFEKVTVSQNQLVIFYANKPLFIGTLIGLAAAAGGVWWLMVRRKKNVKV